MSPPVSGMDELIADTTLSYAWLVDTKICPANTRTLEVFFSKIKVCDTDAACLRSRTTIYTMQTQPKQTYYCFEGFRCYLLPKTSLVQWKDKTWTHSVWLHRITMDISLWNKLNLRSDLPVRRQKLLKLLGVSVHNALLTHREQQSLLWHWLLQTHQDCRRNISITFLGHIVALRRLPVTKQCPSHIPG